MTEVVAVESPRAAAVLVADAIARLVATEPATVLGLATGSTPLAVYQELAARVADGRLDLSSARGFALDEYLGLPPGHPQSYRAVITREVVEPLRMDPALVQVPDGDVRRAPTAGERYERAIAEAGGIDLQILGIGADGHVGFNEPGSSFGSGTRVKTLTERTRADNARFFDRAEDVPIHCVTQGLGTIGRAGRIVVLAFGRGKAEAVAAAVEGPLSARTPASIVQLHPQAAVLVDEDAASLLGDVDYYRTAWLHKPAWQQGILR